jgi:Helicase conserved C-terminal domain
VAWGLRSLFNAPEVCELVRRGGEDDYYWQEVLRYAVDGNLQSVMDEYTHVLCDWLGFVDRDAEDVYPAIAERMVQAISMRTTNYVVDQLSVRDGDVQLDGPGRMRGRFAVRLADDPSDDGRGTTGSTVVRDAFNSPFWPFVLASTSIGQEGLDFHLYCHAVVHWNLPSNPVDLEQREGRVHRFKGHAVRKNVASACGGAALGADVTDPWAAMFSAAAELVGDDSELEPYWVFAREGGARIERHVPMLPMSRDVERLNALRRTLAAYRLAFGQPRQEDLVRYLAGQLDDDRLRELCSELTIDLTPRA